ncbi:hypothetical protein [Bowmanella dokdonensis]|uniref:DUF4412 domain-containing protein n=1 Tax=Bowmanella dokdonensis TaxID=751969 RepID=A0A939DNT8_9ALTE|nr:hypothetical protein [Bowmanella dokdonensis]MBN7825191.1 hypothetical protein [Bowmanella dokdonensis]
MFKSITAATILAALSTAVMADTSIEVKDEQQKKSQLHKTFVSDGKVAVLDSAGRTQVIADTQSGNILVLSHNDKSYSQFDQQSLKEMAGQVGKLKEMAGAMASTYLQNLSPEQKAQMQKMMGDMFPEQKPAPEMELVETDEKEKINGIQCRWLKVKQDGQLVNEACVADLADTPMDQADYQTLGKLMQESAALVGEFVKGEVNRMELGQTLWSKKQVPLMLREYEQGQPVRTTHISMSQVAPPEGAFSLPEGYKKKPCPICKQPE